MSEPKYRVGQKVWVKRQQGMIYGDAVIDEVAISSHKEQMYWVICGDCLCFRAQSDLRAATKRKAKHG